MYLQLIEQIKRRIAVGDWKAGDVIPSIRQLAADVQVSVITVKRAYLELEREGVILTQHGTGSIVAPHTEVVSNLYEEELKSHLEQAAHLGSVLRLTPKELQTRLRAAIEQTAAVTEKP